MKLVHVFGFVTHKYVYFFKPFFRLLYSFINRSLIFHLLQLPEEARELEKELRQITKEKNEAVRGQDFEKVLIYLHFWTGVVSSFSKKNNLILI